MNTNNEELTMDELQVELNRVVEFNKLMGREVGNREHLFLQSQLLVQEGIKELSEAVYKQDRLKLRDALADTAVVAMGGVYISGGSSKAKTLNGFLGFIYKSIAVCVESVADESLNPDYMADDFYDVIHWVKAYSKSNDIDIADDLRAVNDSNLSKFCKSPQEATETMLKYQREFGVPSEYRQTGNEDYPFAVYSTETVGDFTKGKLLKSVNYKSPVFL